MVKVLPLKDAYPFAERNNLGNEVSAIRDMEIEWDRSYTSSLRRGYVIELFQRSELFEAFKQEFWPDGNTSQGQTLIQRYLRIKSEYEEFLSSGEAVLEETADTESEDDREFAAETDLRNFLSKNLECIEPGLHLYQQDGRSGIEFFIEGGRIDILALDRENRFVLLELKLSRGRNKALGQLLYYMGWVDENLGNGPCRGIIVAKEITDDLLLAVRRANGVSLDKYKLSFTLEQV